MLLAIDCGNTNTVFSIWDGARFIATWRNTVAMESSTTEARSASRSLGSSSAPSRRPFVTVSPNTDAVSATVSGVA